MMCEIGGQHPKSTFSFFMVRDLFLLWLLYGGVIEVTTVEALYHTV